jgi:hypothetical protein
MIVKLVALVTTALAITLVSPLSALTEVCLDRPPGNSSGYGDSIVANHKYLVVGESRINRVLVYQRIAKGQWVIIRTISPPANSANCCCWQRLWLQLSSG